MTTRILTNCPCPHFESGMCKTCVKRMRDGHDAELRTACGELTALRERVKTLEDALLPFTDGVVYVTKEQYDIARKALGGGK